jgi:hypothetical protein
MLSVSVCSADPNTLLTVSINATRPPARFECHGARTQPLGARLTMSVGNGGSGIRRRKRCTCVNMGENNINVKTVVERVSVNMGDRGLGVKTVYEPKTISIMI